MTNREGLSKLKELSLQLDRVDYYDIIDIIKNSFEIIPIASAILKENSDIVRVRKNEGEILFRNVDELSYIRNQKVIDNSIKFGRANCPHQVLFYGAIKSTKLPNPIVTAVLEVSELYQNPNKVNLEGELYTISTWSNKEDILIAEIVFSSEAIGINPDIKKAYEKQQKNSVKDVVFDDLEVYMEFLIFISEQFARPKKTHHDYKISTAYTNLVLAYSPDTKGIAFPSVQAQYIGETVAFEPKIIDKYFEIKELSTGRCHKYNNMEFDIILHKNCYNPKECYNNIVWVNG